MISTKRISKSGLNVRGGITVSKTDFNPERIQIQMDGTLLPGQKPAVNTGDTLGNITGVIGYSYGNYELLATNRFTHIPGTAVPETTSLDGNAYSLTIASFNVENLDPNDDDGDSDVADGKFTALAENIVYNLNAPDIIGLQEVQDNDGSTDSGETSASATYTLLIEEITNSGGPAYLWADLPPENNIDGGQPGGNIRVGYLYNPGRVSLANGSLTKITDTDLSDGDAFEASRKSLMAEFRFRGKRITIINNHFASKGGSTSLYGQVRPPVNGNVEQREAQAAVIRDLITGIQSLKPKAKVIVLGDLNEFYFESPLKILDEAGMVNTAASLLPPAEVYSYNYQGNAQALDHIYLTPNLTEAAGVDIVHINSEFAVHSSDHDPIVLKLDFTASRPARFNKMKKAGKYR